MYGIGQKIPFSAVLHDARGVSLPPHHLVHLAGISETNVIRILACGACYSQQYRVLFFDLICFAILALDPYSTLNDVSACIYRDSPVPPIPPHS